METKAIVRAIRDRFAGAILLALTFAGTAWAAPETELYKPALPDLPEAYWQQLRDGEIIVLDQRCEDTRRGEASCLDLVEMMIVERPQDEVFAVVEDCDEHPQYLPSLESARLLDERGRHDKVLAQLWHWEARVLLFDFDIETIVLTDRTHGVIQWTLNPEFDNDLRRSEGHWWFYPLDDGASTLLVYSTVSESSFPLPGFVEDYIAREGAREVLQSTRFRVLSEDTWKKGDPAPTTMEVSVRPD